MIRLYQSVLLSNLEWFIARGWKDTGERDYRPSVDEPIAIVERPAEERRAFSHCLNEWELFE